MPAEHNKRAGLDSIKADPSLTRRKQLSPASTAEATEIDALISAQLQSDTTPYDGKWSGVIRALARMAYRGVPPRTAREIYEIAHAIDVRTPPPANTAHFLITSIGLTSLRVGTARCYVIPPPPDMDAILRGLKLSKWQ